MPAWLIWLIVIVDMGPPGNSRDSWRLHLPRPHCLTTRQACYAAEQQEASSDSTGSSVDSRRASDVAHLLEDAQPEAKWPLLPAHGLWLLIQDALVHQGQEPQH